MAFSVKDRSFGDQCRLKIRPRKIVNRGGFPRFTHKLIWGIIGCFGYQVFLLDPDAISPEALSKPFFVVLIGGLLVGDPDPCLSFFHGENR